MRDNAWTLTQQSMMRKKYHRTPVTYSVTFAQGSGEIAGTGYHVDDVQMMQTVELQLIMS